MSIESVNLLRERVIRAAVNFVKELEESEPMVRTIATRALVRTVKAMQEATWRQDEAPAIIRELLQIVELQPESTSMLSAKIKNGTQGSVLRAKAFLGERKVDDDTTPVIRPRKGILRSAKR